MMLRQHQSVPSGDGDVAENIHVCSCCTASKPGRGQLYTADEQGRWWAARGMGCELQASERRVVRAEDGCPSSLR